MFSVLFYFLMSFVFSFLLSVSALLRCLLFFVLTLVVLVADETVPQKLFVGRAFVFRLAVFFI